MSYCTTVKLNTSTNAAKTLMDYCHIQVLKVLMCFNTKQYGKFLNNLFSWSNHCEHMISKGAASIYQSYKHGSRQFKPQGLPYTFPTVLIRNAALMVC